MFFVAVTQQIMLVALEMSEDCSCTAYEFWFILVSYDSEKYNMLLMYTNQTKQNGDYLI